MSDAEIWASDAGAAGAAALLLTSGIVYLADWVSDRRYAIVCITAVEYLAMIFSVIIIKSLLACTQRNLATKI